MSFKLVVRVVTGETYEIESFPNEDALELVLAFKHLEADDTLQLELDATGDKKAVTVLLLKRNIIAIELEHLDE